MSDEPQQQQPTEGVPPTEPLRAEGPGGPASRDDTAPATAGGTAEPTRPEGAGTPSRSEGAEAPARPAGSGERAEPGQTPTTPDTPKTTDATPATEPERADRGGQARPAAQDRTASMARARQAAQGGRTEPGASAPSGDTPSDRGSASGTAPGNAATGPGAAGTSAAAEQGQSAESTQVLRRVTAPRGAQGAGSGKAAGAAQGSAETGAPESTQVLRRVTAPREAAEPGEAARTAAAAPNTTGRAARTPRTPGPGANRAAQAAGAAAAGAAGLAGAAGQASQAGAAGAAAAGAAGAVAPGPRTGSSSRTAPGPRSATGAGRTVGRDSAGAAEPETGALAAADDGGPGAAEGKGKKAKRPKRTGWRRIIPTWRMVLGGFVVGVLLVIGLFVLGYSMVNIPPANAMAVKQSNVYLYADGSQMARDGDINRENVSLAQVSKDAQHAVLAAEDRDFYSESAIDPKAMLRAAWNTATGKGKQSGSTITQQYVKNYYLAQEQTVTRKAKEFFISIKLDRNKSKDEILEGYLNTSFFGRNAYGIQAAAQAYYGVDAKDLDPARAAYLAALVNAPSEYDVVAHPENKSAAVARWNYVLDGMVKKGWLSESKRAGMKFPMPKEQTVSTGLSGQRGYLVRAVNDYLTKNNIVDTDQLEAGGYRITTTIQKTRQDAFVKAVDDQLISKLDKKNNKVDNYVRAGGASVDPKTGKVVAMYGGIDYVKQYTNGATRGDFQVGSTFKPFVFTSAVQNGSTTQDGRTITPNTTYDGTNERPVQGWSGSGYAPENEDQKSYGQIGVTKATDLSVNAVYAQMAVDVGPSKVKQTAIDLGIPSGTPDLQPYPSIALGTATASVLDMAEGYATLANHGKHGTYTMIEKITKDGTEEVKLPDDQVKQAVSREAADTTTSILQSVVDNGTATAAQAADRPAAGKTGTAENDTAAWFAGYTPDLATVVSVMGQDPVTAKHVGLYGALGQARMNGGGPPTEIWAQYTRDALEGKPASDFDLQLQQGADEPQPPSATGPARPGTTGGQNTGGATASPTGGGATQSPAGGATGTPTDGGATTGTGPGTTGGTTTTTGGTTATGGGATGGGTTTGTGTTGGVTDGGAATGGDAATGGAADGGGGTTGTAAGDGGGPLT